MSLLSKKQIYSADDIKTEVIEVPEWGGQVKIIMLSGFEMDKLEASCVGKNGRTNFNNLRAKTVAACVIDEDGNLMFSEKEVVKLGKKSGAALGRIYEAAQRLNKVTDEDIKELAKN